MKKLVFFCIVLYGLVGVISSAYALNIPLGESLLSTELRVGYKDSIIKAKNLLDLIPHKVSTPLRFPELDKKYPVTKTKISFDAPEFSYGRIQKEFPAPTSSVNNARSEAEASFREIDSTGRWISSFANENIQVLPVGIKQEINGVQYQLGFTRARFHKDYTELTVFVKVLLPQSDDKGESIVLFFGANNVKLSHQGGIIGDANLVLLGDMFIPFNGGNWLLILKGGFDYRTGATQNRTFVTISCDGVQEMGIEGEVQFSRSMLVPVGLYGEPQPETRLYHGAQKEPIQIPNRVTGSFSAIASDWNDMIVAIDLSPFVLASQPDKFMFSVNQAIFDFSDLRTENVNFPQHYFDKGLLLPSPEAWRGVFVQSLEVVMPQEFKTTKSISNNQPVRFEAANLIIDNYGVSGYFSAENLIPLSEGRTAKSNAWAYSVDKIGIEIVTNTLIGADFSGRVLLPIAEKKNTTDQESEDKTQGLAYQGIISENEYAMTVSTLDTIAFDVFKAKAELLPNSGVELAVVDGNFLPKAVLHGRMAISASQKESLKKEGESTTSIDSDGRAQNNTVEFKGIAFEGMVIQTVSPIFDIAYLGYQDEVKLANFPVSIANIAYAGNGQQAGLLFDLNINLMGKESKGFAAEARLGIYGAFQEEHYKQHWKFDRLDLSSIAIDANTGFMQLNGSLELMDNDPIYGDGFSAEIAGTFGKEGSGIGPISCKAIFGRSDFRYWYVDAAVHGLKINIGPLQISGFAGGAFYKMSRVAGAGTDFSPSGLSYIPEKDAAFGVKAMLFGAIPDESAAAVGAGFEIEINRNGGVNRLGLFGEAQFMKAFDFPNPVAKLQAKLGHLVDNEKLQKVANSDLGNIFLDKATNQYKPEVVGAAGISAKMGMEFDFKNSSFHATLDLYVNVAGGVIAGRASGGRAGWGVVHIDPDEFYVYMGTPDDRLGLKMGVGSLKLEVGGYFMLGDRIPGSPPPPPEVADILGVDLAELDYMRDENLLGEGKGIAFGTDFSVDTGDINFLILYARFQAGLGYDIMVKDYGNARCSNTGDQIGINGWYANGQAYAYLQGELGINIKLFFIRKKIPIIRGAAALLMQAKGPNPFWIRGYATGEYDLLGGLVRGSFRLKVTIGEQCVIENSSPLGGIKMITDITPKEGDSNIDVFAAPQAAFAMKINEPIVIPEDSGDKTYKVILEKFTITDQSGKEIKATLEWGRMNDRVSLISEDILPPNTKLKATVEVSFQERINGVFRVIKEDGKKAIEKEERSFTTGTAPNHIPLHNIQYAYPVVDQHYFYSDEYPTGYIQLKRGQDYLFDDTHWESLVKYTDESGKGQTVAFNYMQGDNKVDYTLPKVSKETNYVLSIISSPKRSSTSRTKATTTKTKEFGEDNTMKIRKNTAETVLKDGEIERLSYGFKSSEYKTFRDKINSLKTSEHLWGDLSTLVIFLSSKVQNHEAFEVLELVGGKYSGNKPLIRAESDLQDAYFTNDIDPILYSKYLENSSYSLTRDVSKYGYIPKKALPISSHYLTSVENNVNQNWTATHFPFRYNLTQLYYQDYLDVRDRVMNDYANGLIAPTSQQASIISTEFLFMLQGKYNIHLQYILPGGIKGSSANYQYKNPLKFRG